MTKKRSSRTPKRSVHAYPLPRRFGEYELLEEVGSGGMGIVYKARQSGLDRLVAIKVMRSGSFASDTERKRFYSEARAAGKLKHPNIINVHQVGEADGQHYFSMDYVKGRDLGELCGEASVDHRELARTLCTVAEAIHSAHEAGILHRDVKPANIIIDEAGIPHVTDFGLAKDLESDSALTSTGAAPRHAQLHVTGGCDRRRHRTCGRTCTRPRRRALRAPLGKPALPRPHSHGDRARGTSRRSGAHLPPSDRPSTQPWRRSPLKCLEKLPAHRYASARAFARDLERYLDGRPIEARPLGTDPARGDVGSRNVPVLAALTGKAHPHTKTSHHVAQWAVITLIAAAALWLLLRTRDGGSLPMPAEVRIASAMPGGGYHDFSERLAPALSRGRRASGRRADDRRFHRQPATGSSQARSSWLSCKRARSGKAK